MVNRCSANYRLRSLAILASLLFAGCASQSYVVLLPDPDGAVGKVLVKGAAGEQLLTEASQGVPLSGDKAPAPVDAKQIEKDFGLAMAARPPLPQRFLLYFQTGGVELTPESRALIAQIKGAVENRQAADISVIGHSDTVGKAENNEALALKRAQEVANLLQQSGVSPLAVVVESHGERNLLVKTPDETAEPRNRRVEVSVR